MSRATSIPKSLHIPILFRWRAGASPTAIVRWIEETNGGRKEPVHTSRSSVQRLVQALADTDAHCSRIQAIQRAYLDAPEAMDRLENIQGRFEALYEEASQPNVDLKSLHGKVLVLTRWHGAVHRDLRLAGITGSAAERMLKENGSLLAKHRLAAVAADRDLPREIPEVGDVGWILSGLAEESAPKKQPEQPAAAPATPPAPSPDEAGGVDRVPESNALKLKPIDESIRAGFRSPERAHIPRAANVDGVAFHREASA